MDADDWAGFYLDHPIGRLARLLVWRFGDLVAMPLDATTAVTPAARHTRSGAMTVELGYPIARPATRSPRGARTCSRPRPCSRSSRPTASCTRSPGRGDHARLPSRFAGHVFRQVQAKSLMKKAAGSPSPSRGFDDGIDHGVARRIADAGVRAEFRPDPRRRPRHDRLPLLHLRSGALLRGRHRRRDRAAQRRSSSSPRRCATSTCSSASPRSAPIRWLDRREGRRFEIYWNEFGLARCARRRDPTRGARRAPARSQSPTAASSTTAGSRCAATRTYRIHLGSGNIPCHRTTATSASSRAATRRRKRCSSRSTMTRRSASLAKAFLLAADEIDDLTIPHRSVSSARTPRRSEATTATITANATRSARRRRSRSTSPQIIE